MKLHDYKKEISAIAKANHCSMEDAADMFLNNIHDVGMKGDQFQYHGADETDYAALAPNLKELQDDYNNFNQEVREEGIG